MSTLDPFRDILMAGLTLIYDDGLLYNVPRIDDGKGGYGRGSDDGVGCKATIDSVTDQMKAEEGYTASDVALYVLQTPGLTLSTDSEVFLLGTRYLIGSISEDPARAAWACRATPNG